jgi:alpha-mannosidase
MKTAVRGLVREGRLEFVNAGYSMHDEACTHYEDQINNMIVGHDFLMREFGVRPRVGWHIDPFGHSTATPRLFAEMGFDAFFISRIDFQDKAKRLQDKSMQWMWRPFFNHTGKSTSIFTSTFYDHYCWPGDFGDEPVIVDESLSTDNAWKRVEEFFEIVMH